MSHILIVGQKFSTLSNYIENHGHTYTLLQDVKKTKFADKKFKDRVVADFSKRETVLKALELVKHPIDGVMATYENYVLPAAWIAEQLDLPGMPIAAAEACTDKSIMRTMFATAAVKISPGFAVVSTKTDVIKFADEHTFPLILKPANLAKSLLVTRSDSMDELLENYSRSIDLLHTTYRKYAPNRTPKLIIEEFLEGSIHSVDAFVDSAGYPHILENVVDYQTGYDIGFEDNFHYSRLLPSKLSPNKQAELRECADAGIKALGMKNSPAHIEIIITPKGPRIVEIGARNGGYRERMHYLANGIDITGAALAIIQGQIPDIKPHKNDHCAVLELFPKNPGTFSGISNLESLEALPSLNYLSIKVQTGDKVGKAADGYKMCAVLILHSDNYKQFSTDLSFIKSRVEVTTKQ